MRTVRFKDNNGKLCVIGVLYIIWKWKWDINVGCHKVISLVGLCIICVENILFLLSLDSSLNGISIVHTMGLVVYNGHWSVK